MDTRDGFNLNVSLAREANIDDYITKTPDNKYLMQATSFVVKNYE